MGEISNKIYEGKLKSSKEIAKQTYEITFSISEKFTFEPGQYLWVELLDLVKKDPKGKRRAFSIISTPSQKGEVSILFRKGRSNYKKTLLSLKKGASVRIIGPLGSSFVIKEDFPYPVTLIAGGVGVSPFLSLLRHYSSNKSSIKFCLIYLNSSKNRTPYIEELKKMAKENKNFTLLEKYSRLNRRFFKKVPFDIKKSIHLISGPQEMVDHVNKILGKLKVSRENRLHEQFYPSPKHDIEIERADILREVDETSVRERMVRTFYPIVILMGLLASLLAGGYFLYLGKSITIHLTMFLFFIISLILWAIESFRKYLTNLTIFFVYILLVWVFMTGGISGDAIYWIEIFPIITFLVMGSGGILWIISYITTISLLFYTRNFGVIPFPYEVIQAIEGMVVLVTFSLIVFALSIIEALTERRIEEIDDKKQVFLDAVQSSTNHVVITDINGRVLYANKASQEITGFSLSEMRDHTPRLWGGEMDPSTYREIWREKKMGRTWSGEIKNRKKSGELYSVLAKISPIKDARHGIIGYVGTETDISRLKEIDRMKTEFISVASHELRTPMTAIKGFLSMINEGDYGKVPKKMTKPLDDVYESTQRLIHLVNDMLNVSRIEAGRLKFDIKEFDISGVVTDAAKQLVPVVKQKSLKLSINDIPSRKVSADRNKIIELINNLVGNAIKYTKEGEIKIYGEVEGEVVKIFIEDTGVGISDEDQIRLFQKFSQADRKGMQQKGTGLGLYISKGVAQKMGGDIWLEKSVLGKGSTFAFSVPLAGSLRAKKANAVIENEAQANPDQKDLSHTRNKV